MDRNLNPDTASEAEKYIPILENIVIKQTSSPFVAIYCLFVVALRICCNIGVTKKSLRLNLEKYLEGYPED